MATRHPCQRIRAFTFIEMVTVVFVISILAAIAVTNFLDAQTRTKTARTWMDLEATKAGINGYYADYHVYPSNHKDIRGFLLACGQFEFDNETSLYDALVNEGLLNNPPGASFQPGGFGEGAGGFGGNPFGGLQTGSQVQKESSQAGDSIALPTPPDSKISYTQNDPDYLNRPENFRLSKMERTQQSLRYYGNRFPAFSMSGYDLSQITTPVAYADSRLAPEPFADIGGVPFVYINLADVIDQDPRLSNLAMDQRFYLLSYGPDVDQSATDGFADLMNPVTGPALIYDPTNGTISRGDIIVLGSERGDY